MASAPYHTDDKAIRETLYKLNLLDTPLEERFERITRMVQIALGVPMSAFSLIDRERQWFKSIQGIDATENTRSVSFCAYTILGDDVMVIPDAKADPRFSKNPLVTGDPNIKFYAGCPVRAPDGRNIGSLCAIDSKSRSMTPDQIEMLRNLALMIEAELKVSQLSKAQNDLIHELDQTQRLALIDPLTRIWNKAGIDDILKREWAFTSRKNIPLSMIIADIDGFKKINDQHGSEKGNRILQEIGKRFLKALRQEDAVGRVGGEEFMVIMPDVSPEHLEETAERIRRAVSEEPYIIDGKSIIIEITMGAASIMPHGRSSQLALITAADNAIHRAKSNGKNRTEISAA